LEALANPNCGWFYRQSASAFEMMPGTPIAYWASKATVCAFINATNLSEVASPKVGVQTGDNEQYLRHWWEISTSLMCFPQNYSTKAKCKWYPCNKGGGYRKWYGNNEIVIKWENQGEEIKQAKGSVIRNPSFYFKEGITWGTISSSDLSMRYASTGFMFETKGSMCFASNSDDLLYCLAFTNSSVVKEFQKILSPTLDYHEGPMGKLPLYIKQQSSVVDFSKRSIANVKEDWDMFETSWDFKRHPLL
jgi:type II restriction/modification system DNA methylase subunit YeeA